jgi:hypothetical protein
MTEGYTFGPDGGAGDGMPQEGVGAPFRGLQVPDVAAPLPPGQLTPWARPDPTLGKTLEQTWAALRGTVQLGGTFTCSPGNGARCVDVSLPIADPVVLYIEPTSLALAPDATDAEIPWAATINTGSGGATVQTVYGLTTTGLSVPLRTTRFFVDVEMVGGRSTQRLTFNAAVGRGIATRWHPQGDSRIFAGAGTVDLQIPFAADALTVSVGPGGAAIVHGFDLLGNDRFGQYPVAASTTQVFSIPRQVVDIQIEVGVAAVVWWGWESTT